MHPAFAVFLGCGGGGQEHNRPYNMMEQLRAV